MMAQAAPDAPLHPFLDAWGRNDFGAACAALDRTSRAETTAKPWTEIAILARRACARDALANAEPERADSQLAAARALGMSAQAGARLQARIDVELAALQLRRGRVSEALMRLRRLPPGGLPESVQDAVVSAGLEAVETRRWETAQDLFEVVERRAPRAYRVERLRALLWWHQHGYWVGLGVAGGCFALLLVLLGRTLLRIRRQAQALLRS
jgi:hypothetical protein